MIQTEQEFTLMLAHELNQPSPRQMLYQMSSTEYLDWQKYFANKGFRVENDNWRMGTIASSVWNVNLKPDERLTPQQFYQHEPQAERSDDELMQLGNNTGGIRFG